MSYILDALRRAEAQRDRGAVPGIHAQPGSGLPSATAASRPGTAVWWGLAVLVLAAVAAFAWFMAARDARRDAVRNVAVVAVPAPVQVAAPTPSTAPSPTPAPALVPSSAATVPPARVQGVAPAQGALAPVPAATPAPVIQAARPASATPAVRAPASAIATPLPAAAPVNTVPRIYTREELPGDVRAQLPTLNINGSTYSENPAHRLLIANGQVFHENDKIAADLVVEQIRARAVLLSFRGYRYLVPY